MTTSSRSNTPICMNIVDVYDLSSIIGREFEVLIDHFGTEAMTPLLKKVMQALEALEDSILTREKDEQLIFEMKRELERLEATKAMFQNLAEKNERQLDEAEHARRDESESMQQLIKTLRAENIELKKSLRKHSVEFQKHQDESTKEEIELLTKLQRALDQQRSEMRTLRKEISQKNEEFNAVQQQSSRLAKLNAALRRRQSASHRKAEVIVEEKALLESQLREKEHHNQRLQALLSQHGIRVPEAMSLSENELEAFSLSDKRRLSGEQLLFLNNNEEFQVKLNGTDISSEELITEEIFYRRLKQQGKVVIDTKDPNRPRYTLQEFQVILLEKTELKAQIDELQEELNALRGSDEEHSSLCSRSDYSSMDGAGGPNSKKESGIKKFFSNLFSSSSGVPPTTKVVGMKTLSSNDEVFSRSIDSIGEANIAVIPSIDENVKGVVAS